MLATMVVLNREAEAVHQGAVQMAAMPSFCETPPVASMKMDRMR
ncbi:hypothetical protein [Corallococcus exiguus]|nr:hypothetical protein [Corallococcus exiguus]